MIDGTITRRNIAAQLSQPVNADCLSVASSSCKIVVAKSSAIDASHCLWSKSAQARNRNDSSNRPMTQGLSHTHVVSLQSVIAPFFLPFPSYVLCVLFVASRIDFRLCLPIVLVSLLELGNVK